MIAERIGDTGVQGDNGAKSGPKFAFEAAPDGSGDPAFYLKRADECRRAAETTADAETRDQWLQLANQWMHLVLHADRRVRRARTGRQRDPSVGNA